jgi:hypothetical protein
VFKAFNFVTAARPGRFQLSRKFCVRMTVISEFLVLKRFELSAAVERFERLERRKSSLAMKHPASGAII